MGQKTARELLEEATTMIAMPVAIVGDQQVTGWVQDEEWGKSYWDGKGGKYTVIDPEAVTVVVEPAYTSVVAKSVCSIGAIALADLTNDGLHFKGEWTGWDVQVMVNPQVALAGIALIQKILEPMGTVQAERHLKSIEEFFKWLVDAENDERSQEFVALVEEKGLTPLIEEAKHLIQSPLGDIVKATQEKPLLVQFTARALANVITLWNDHHDRTYLEVADMFQAATKSLIEAEG